MKKIFWTRSLFLLLVVLSNSSITQTWEKLNMVFPPTDTLLENTTMNFVNKNTGWIVTSGNPKFGNYRTRILETKSGGLNWQIKLDLGNYVSFYSTCNIDSNNIWFMGVTGDVVFTNNNGADWDTSRVTYENINTSGNFFTSLHFFDSKKGIAFNNYRWFTNDGGYTWIKGLDTGTIFPITTDVYFVDNKLGWIVSMLNPFVTDGGSIGNTTNGGKTWKYLDSITNITYGIYFIDSLKGFTVGTNVKMTGGVLRSTKDGGKSWSSTTYEGIGPFRKVKFLDSLHGWICGTGKILRTTDGGVNWEIQVDGLPTNFEQMKILHKDKVAYALGKDWNGKTNTLLRADLSNLTEVKSDINILPEVFKLSQNYPNPFNPSTTISYQIPSHNFVTLRVYDVLGNEVAVLVNEWQEPGSYNAQFTTSGKQLASGMSSKGGYASGVYFYTLTAGKFTDTKKFILLK